MQMWVDEAKKKLSHKTWNKTKMVMVWMMTKRQRKQKEKTDSGKEMTPVETSVKMPKTKNEKNKV